MSDSKVEENRGATRWVVLFLMSLVVFANYYLYDCFSTLKGTLQTELGASSTQWGLIRNFYNVPNTFLFMALLGGIFLDRFGIRKTGFIFTLLCALGGIVTAYGVSETFRAGEAAYQRLHGCLHVFFGIPLSERESNRRLCRLRVPAHRKKNMRRLYTPGCAR